MVRLLGEVEVSQTLIASLRGHLANREQELKDADETIDKQSAAYEKALTEIRELRAKIANEEAALRERQKQVEELRAEIARVKGQRKLVFVAGVVTGVGVTVGLVKLISSLLSK